MKGSAFLYYPQSVQNKNRTYVRLKLSHIKEVSAKRIENRIKKEYSETSEKEHVVQALGLLVSVS